jgi:membrane protease subunit HflC
MINRLAIPAIILLALGVVLTGQALFTVDQTEQAIVLQLGQPQGTPRGPGLHFKIPFIQNVRYFDRRILSVDPGPEQMVIASASIPGEKPPAPPLAEGEIAPPAEPDIPSINVTGEPIIVDTFARYKIIDPLQFMKTLGTVYNANSRIQNILSDATKTVLAKTSLQDLLSSNRAKIMTEIRDRVNNNTHQDALGIEIVDVRIVRADLTAALLTSTVQRMKSELKERATETRAEGEEQALEIRSTAEKERSVLLAEAERDAQIIRGEGDKEAITIYAEAFNKDKEFYSFIRSMEAYRNTLSDPDTRLILSPNSDFFRYFENYRSGTP